jgi:NADPH-dependent 2,4-dienoyl-CoA reductase/sulfur reductase-like enzyme
MEGKTDVLIIGAGPAGIAAATALWNSGIKNIKVIEREQYPGGVLHQCIHDGFGLHRYGETYTGPEYADIIIQEAEGIPISTGDAVVSLTTDGNSHKAVILSRNRGVYIIEARAVILSMGCRERTRGNISIPGTRPAGIMTAGLAQKLVNVEGCLPGKEVVILGSGDIGLIMARRLTWEGAHVAGVVEIQPYPGGLPRNVVQCLEDYNIPLYLSHTIVKIHGSRRIEMVDIAPLGKMKQPLLEEGFSLPCDTLLLSVGLIPENELSREAGVELHTVTGGPIVDDSLMTNIPGIFACGNVLHVHDLVDYVSEEGERCGNNTAEYLRKTEEEKESKITVRPGNMVKYVLPMKISRTAKNIPIYLRTLDMAEKGSFIIQDDEKILYEKNFRGIHPGSIIRLDLPQAATEKSTITVNIKAEK